MSYERLQYGSVCRGCAPCKQLLQARCAVDDHQLVRAIVMLCGILAGHCSGETT